MDIKFIIVDLFCGAGGTTTGFEVALSRDGKSKIAKVVACVNHDPIAIKSHWKNHPEVYHFEEDITLLYGIVKHGIFMQSPQFLRLVRLVNIYRAFYPDAKVILWASLECTNFSKAKGGMSRDADSRTLADHLHPYIIALDPDYVKIENVVEFMTWGPMIPKMDVSSEGYQSCRLVIKKKKGKVIEVQPHMIPDPKFLGRDWNRWREAVCSHGYFDEWKQLNSADFGALTSRNRLFGCFAKKGLPIVWPKATHAKKPKATTLTDPLKRWEPVKKVLDFKDEGESIFNRWKRIPRVSKTKDGYEFSKLKKYNTVHKTFGPIPDPLSTKTMQRLYMGCVKHIAGGKQAFLSRYYGGNPEFRNHSIDEPAGALRVENSHAIVKAAFIQKYNSNKANGGGNDGASVNLPAPTVAAQPRMTLAQVCFIDKAYSGDPKHMSSTIEQPAGVLTTIPNQQRLVFISRYNGVNGGKHDNSKSVEDPIGALSCNDTQSKVTLHFIDKQYGGDANHQSIEGPSGAILKNDKHALISAGHYLLNPSWGGANSSVNDPCPVVVARQDKAPLYLIAIENGFLTVPVYDTDCEWTIKLKEFMVLYGICDIKMRMLKVMELKLIQGFPENYILDGTQADQKKFIGNSVHPKVPKVWVEAFDDKFEELKMAA